MGGPGLLGVVGTPKTLATVEAPMDKKILIDMGAFHPLLVCASYNKSTPFDAVAFVKNTLLRKFEGLNVEFFFDGDGNAEKYNTSTCRRNRRTELAAAEAKIQVIEQLASRGQGIKESDYKLLQKTLCHSKFVEYNIDILLSAAGFLHAQFQALGVVSHKDYSWNLPGLGIGNNSRIIKSISDGHDSVTTVLHRYEQNPAPATAASKSEALQLFQDHGLPIGVSTASSAPVLSSSTGSSSSSSSTCTTAASSSSTTTAASSSTATTAASSSAATTAASSSAATTAASSSACTTAASSSTTTTTALSSTCTTAASSSACTTTALSSTCTTTA
ncbi:hypothetical protein BGZ82_003246 [Podila clonocystis]|nr:hypothetical protein BGZ82_003246 [Podila clonocystis]